MNQVFKDLLAMRKLPTPSTIALEIMHLSTVETASLRDLADIVEKDPALSGKLLKYANTVLFATKAPVVSIRQAIVRLGTDIVMGLSLGFSLLSKNRKGRCEQFDYSKFWSDSLAMAMAARGLAEIHGGFDPDELFVCGLLSEIGRLALASLYPQEYSEILAVNPNEPALLLEENKGFGIDHVEISTELLQEWGIPQRYIDAIALLKELPPEKIIGQESLDLHNLFRLSRLMAEICVTELPAQEKSTAATKLAEQHAIGSEKFNLLFERILSSWQEWSLLLEIPDQECLDSGQLQSIKAEELKPTQIDRDEIFCILVVDDDPLSIQSLKKFLKKSATTILTAENGNEALRLAIHHQPDLIITNRQLPGLSGIELCKMLRKTEFGKHLYIIMLTANESDDELVQAFEAGADDYLGKPFTPKVLEARIRGGKRIVRYQENINQDRSLIQNYADKLTAVTKKFHTMAMTDPLTGLPNRRFAMERLQEMMTESARLGNTLSCIMIDIDHFKQINDTYGHDCGDIVLKEIAIIFKKKSRISDMISRIGGEEFLVISDRNSLHESVVFAERLRQEIAEHDIALPGRTVRITISLGVAIMTPDMSDGNSLIMLADRALYSAKKNGRNRVEIAQTPRPDVKS